MRAVAYRLCHVFLLLFGVGWLAPAAAGGHDDLIRVYGDSNPTAFGGYTVSIEGLNEYYVIGIEVPPGAAQLVIDIFDADVGAGGAADISGDRDNQNGGAWDSYHIYTLFDEQLNFIPFGNYNYLYGDATFPVGSDNAWTTFYSTTNPTPGHWVMLVYPYPSEANGGLGESDDLNAFMVRAHDGDPGPGGTEFNVYMISPIPIGTNGIPGSSQGSVRQRVYPYVTSGCDLNTHDFDSDVPTLPGGSPPLDSQIQLTNRTGNFTHTVTQATMSGQDAWVNNNIGPNATSAPSGTDYLRDGMGIWSGLLVLNEQGTGGATAGANYSEVIIADFNNQTPVPASAIEAGTFRWYTPTDAGTAPVKTYVTQRVNFWSGPNPPQVGQTTEVEIEIEVFNPTAYSVTFSQANNDLVRSFIPAVPELAFVAGSVTVSQGTAPGVAGLAVPAGGGTGALEWDPGVIAAGGSALLTYRIAVTPSATGQRIAVTGTPTANGTTADFVDHTGNRNSPFANYTFGPLCELAVTEAQTVPTPVYLSHVLLSGVPGDYQLQWSTAFEAGNAAFRVYSAKVADDKHFLGELPVVQTGTVAGADYTLRLPAPLLERVWLVDVALDGVETWHGPFVLNQPFGKSDVARIQRAPLAERAASGAENLTQRAAWQQRQAVPAINLVTDRPGVYRVSFDTLRAQGYDYTGLPSDALQLVYDGEVVPVLFNPQHDGIIRPGDYLEFIADENRSLYTSQSAYRLQAGQGRRGKTLGSRHSGDGGLFTAQARIRWEQNNTYSFSSPDTESDPWYWQGFLVRDEPVSAALDFEMPPVDPSRSAAIRLRVWTMTDWPGVNKDHHVQVAVNGLLVADFYADGLGNQKILGHLPAGVVQTGANTLELAFPADTGVAYELNYLDEFTVDAVLQVKAQWLAQNDPLLFPRLTDSDAQPVADDVIFRDWFDDESVTACHHGPCQNLPVDGQGNVVAYQRRDQQLWRIIPEASAPGQNLTLLPQSLADSWVLAEGQQYAPVIVPASKGRIEITDGSDFLVIAPEVFFPALQPWLQAKQDAGHVISLVARDEIYHRYSNGLPDGQAIRRLIAEVAQRQPLKYVLLVGADRYDYLDYLGFGQPAVLPGLYAATGLYVRYAPVDAALGDVNGDGVPDVAVGRWPVTDESALMQMVAKSLALEEKLTGGDPMKSVMLLDADDGTTSFASLLDAQPVLAPMPWQTQVVDGNDGRAQSDFLQALNQNPVIVEYLGHSSATQWSAQALLSTADADDLPNDGLSLVLQWGCWNNYAVSPRYVSLAESLLQSAATGAALTVGATAIVDAKDELIIRKHFLAHLARGMSVGAALLKAKQALLSETGADAENLQAALAGITILGDPSIRLVN